MSGPILCGTLHRLRRSEIHKENGGAGATSMPAESFETPEKDIFISYSSEDVMRVQILVTALEAEVGIFLGPRVPPGEDWELT